MGGGANGRNLVSLKSQRRGRGSGLGSFSRETGQLIEVTIFLIMKIEAVVARFWRLFDAPGEPHNTKDSPTPRERIPQSTWPEFRATVLPDGWVVVRDVSMLT